MNDEQFYISEAINTALEAGVELDVLTVVSKQEAKQLHIPGTDIEEINDDVKLLAWSMAKTMYGEPGVGLAAPQVGTPVNLIVIDPTWTQTNNKQPVFMINPEIIWKTEDGINVQEESCLSVPGLSIPIERYDEIEVKFLDLQGEEHEMWCDEWTARIVQHEMDHLEGTLLSDRLSPLKLDMYMRKVAKAKRQAKAQQRRAESYARNFRTSQRRVARSHRRKLQRESQALTREARNPSNLNWRKPEDNNAGSSPEQGGFDS